MVTASALALFRASASANGGSSDCEIIDDTHGTSRHFQFARARGETELNTTADPEQLSLAGQVAVITGGGRGLGRAFARSLAAAGAKVALIARSEGQLVETAAEITAAGGAAIWFAADVTDWTAANRIVDQVERQLGPVNLLVNNAGAATTLGPVAETEPRDWWRCFEVNLLGPYLYTRAVLPGMIALGRGRIINIASGAGLVAIPNLSGYVTSKAGLIRFTEVLATEVREHGISVFGIEPGTVRTAMAEQVLESPEAQRWMPWFGKIFEQGRDVPPDHAARLVLMLASGEADELTGCFLDITDDPTALVEQAEQIRQEALYTLRLRKLK
jgi:NAD(P)-dependent dehydrogenase (short-subunit alcohol dehydrogenase family)